MFLDLQENQTPVFPGEHDRGKRDVRERMKVCKSAVTQKRTRGLEGQKEETEASGKEAELFQLKVKSKTDPPPSKANAVIRQSPHIKALLPVTDMSRWYPSCLALTPCLAVPGGAGVCLQGYSESM